jgi:hypothetical protein
MGEGIRAFEKNMTKKNPPGRVRIGPGGSMRRSGLAGSGQLCIYVALLSFFPILSFAPLQALLAHGFVQRPLTIEHAA